MNNLHIVRNSETFSVFLLNVCSLATSIFNPVLGWEFSSIAASPYLSTPVAAANITWICTEGDDIYRERTKLVLVSSSNLYLLLDSISISTSRPSSSSASYYLLTTYFY